MFHSSSRPAVPPLKWALMAVSCASRYFSANLLVADSLLTFGLGRRGQLGQRRHLLSLRARFLGQLPPERGLNRLCSFHRAGRHLHTGVARVFKHQQLPAVGCCADDIGQHLLLHTVSPWLSDAAARLDYITRGPVSLSAHAARGMLRRHEILFK